jgi:hypothetical protein
VIQLRMKPHPPEISWFGGCHFRFTRDVFHILNRLNHHDLFLCGRFRPNSPPGRLQHMAHFEQERSY